MLETILPESLLSYTIFATPWHFVVTCLVLLAAQIVYVVFGFGSGMIAVGSLALIFPEIKDVVVLLLLINLPAEASVVARSWRSVNWRGLVSICLGIAVGIPIGTRILAAGDPTLVLALLGGFLVLVGGLFLALPSRRPVVWPRGSGPPVGLFSGLLTGLFGTGGPPLIVYYHLSGLDKTAFRGQLMAIFLLKTVVRVPAYALAGLITAPRLWSSLAVMPAVLLGTWLGHRIHVRIAEPTFRKLVCLLLGAIGILLLWRSGVV